MEGIGSGKYVRKKRKIKTEDHPQIIILFQQTGNMAEVGRKYNVSREAIRQHLESLGLSGKSLKKQKEELAKQLFSGWVSSPQNYKEIGIKNFRKFCDSQGLKISFKTAQKIMEEGGCCRDYRFNLILDLVKKHGVRKASEKIGLKPHNIYCQFVYHKIKISEIQREV